MTEVLVDSVVTRQFFPLGPLMLMIETKTNQGLNNERWRKSKLVWLTQPEFCMGDGRRKSQNSVLRLLVLTNADFYNNRLKLLLECLDPNESVYS